jgi:DNA-directed RNA polymerase
MTHEELMAVERELEVEAVGLGQARYFAQLEAAGAERSIPGMELLKKMVLPTAQAVEAWVTDALSGKPGPGAGLAKYLSMFDAPDVAFLTCRVAVEFMFGSRKLVDAAMQVTRCLDDLAASDALQKADPKGFKRLLTKIKRNPLPNKRYVLVRRAEKAAQVTRISWGLSERCRVGQLLLDLCASASGAFTIELVRMGKRHYGMLLPDATINEWFGRSHNRCSLMAPRYLPMVVPPRPWKSPWNGGYLDGRSTKLRLFNSVRMNKNYLTELAQEPMPHVYGSINALQSTPWRINRGILDAMKAVWDGGGSLGGLPPRAEIQMPACPWGEGTPPTEKALMDYSAARARVHEGNRRNGSRRRALLAQLWLAEKFQDFDAIYFPHALDWRGRMYPVPAHLNPQVEDSGKALLEFANGCALGDEGAFWLAVHGANSYGVDKVPFDKRVAWVEQNQDAILDSALRPLDGARFWTEADDPYTFLAFCKEWAGLMSHVARGETQETFVSHLPVSWDGSCNGLQNFSAMLRDPIGGAATNLVPSDIPADIYQRVADVASKQVEKDAARGEVNATYWLGKVTRKIAKRPTMTLPYGSGRYGFRDQLREELDKLRLDNNKPYIEGDEFLCSLYMANVLYDSLGQVVVAARQAMDWLQEVSQVAAKENLPLWWTTPAGLRVMQDYKETVGMRITCFLSGKRVDMTLQVDSTKLDTRKQAQGIAPNFVHSLDAAHLMRTVVKCLDAGITSFAMVHDSYGTHAGNAGALRDMLREAFVEQYGNRSVLEDFRRQLAEQLTPELAAKLPPVPPMGTLDLTAVTRSEYFFA